MYEYGYNSSVVSKSKQRISFTYFFLPHNQYTYEQTDESLAQGMK